MFVMIRKLFFSLIVLSFLLGGSAFVFAQNNAQTATVAEPANTSPIPDPANSTIQNGQSASGVTDIPLRIKLKNPLKVNTLQEAISLFMDAVIKIAIPFIVVFLIWSGLKFILARGNAKELETAKKTFWYTVIGALLILGAWAITDAIVGTINSIAS